LLQKALVESSSPFGIWQPLSTVISGTSMLLHKDHHETDALKAENHTIAFWIRFLVKANFAVNHGHDAISELTGGSATKK